MSSVNLKTVSTNQVNFQNYDLDSQLENALKNLDFDKAIDCLKQGANPTTAVEADLELTKKMFFEIYNDERADISLKESLQELKEFDFSPAAMAIILNHKELLDAVLEAYKQINQVIDNDFVFRSPEEGSYGEVIQADLEYENIIGVEALALMLDRKELLEVLLDPKTASLNYMNTIRDNGNELKKAAIVQSSNKCLQLLNDIGIGNGGIVGGGTCLHLAATYGNYEGFKILMADIPTYYLNSFTPNDYKSLAEQRDYVGRNILHYAAQSDSSKVEKRLDFIKNALIDYPDLDINNTDYAGYTPLALNMRYNHDMILGLLKLQADPNIATFYNKLTPFHIYLSKRDLESINIDTVAAFLEYGADPELQDRNGDTVIDIIEKRLNKNAYRATQFAQFEKLRDVLNLLQSYKNK